MTPWAKAMTPWARSDDPVGRCRRLLWAGAHGSAGQPCPRHEERPAYSSGPSSGNSSTSSPSAASASLTTR
jgi:hypothetical protein